MIRTFARALGVLALLASPNLADEWVALDAGAGGRGAGPTVRVLESTDRCWRAEVRIPGFWRAADERDGRAWDRLRLPGGGSTREIGRPELPEFRLRVEVPPGRTGEASLAGGRAIDLPGRYLPCPVQDDTGIEDGPVAPFELVPEAYRSGEPYPAEAILARTLGRRRGRDVLSIQFAPLSWIASTRTLQARASIEVRVDFRPDAAAAPAPAPGAAGCDYLIVTHPSLSAAARRLAAVERARGLSTRIATTGEIGGTAAAIEAYVDAAMRWRTAPTYLCLLGDAELVPTVYRTEHPSGRFDDGSRKWIGSDHAYACVDGPADYEADLLVGRLPADDLAEAEAMIEKLEDQLARPADPAALGRVLLASYFQDGDGDGREDRSYVKSAEEIGDQWRALGKTIARAYEAPRRSEPRRFSDGRLLPTELRPGSGFEWNAGARRIENAIEAGTFLVVHRDHGSHGGWIHPSYRVGDLERLANPHLPVVLSINCSTGFFDTETCQEQYPPARRGDSFSETLLAMPRAGAVAVVASTRISFTGPNDVLAEELSRALTTPGIALGEALRIAKERLADRRGDGRHTRATQEMFHLFGDPAAPFEAGLEGPAARLVPFALDADSLLRAR